MRRSWTLPRLLLLGGALSAAMVLATLSLFLTDEHSAAGASPDFGVTTLAGMEYEAIYARPIDLNDAADRQIVAGLPARDRRLQHGEILFGAFIAFTNASTHPLRSADRIELRHDSGQLDQALALPKSNAYAYSPRVVRPGVRIPSQNSQADENLAAGGLLVLFRISAREYSNGGTFELVIHDPLHPTHTASLLI